MLKNPLHAVLNVVKIVSSVVLDCREVPFGRSKSLPGFPSKSPRRPVRVPTHIYRTFIVYFRCTLIVRVKKNPN